MRVVVQLPATEDAVRDARDLIHKSFGDELPAITLYDLLTVVSELIANAIRHGEGEMVGLTVETAGDGSVKGEVRNRGRGHVRPRPIDLRRGDGLGLHIVDAIAASWHVKGVGFTCVAFELRSL